MKCLKCNKEIRSKDLICFNCGLPVNVIRQGERMKKVRKTFHQPTKVVDKDKKKLTRTQRKKLKYAQEMSDCKRCWGFEW